MNLSILYYGVDASAEMISHMTDRILPIAKEWQNRPLEKKYAMMDITKKWTGKSWDWGQTLDQLCIYFGERVYTK